MNQGDRLDLLDWRRRVSELYAAIRRADDPPAAWDGWRAVRRTLFTTHGQSPLEEPARAAFAGPHYFAYDPAFRVLGEVEEAQPESYEIPSSGGGTFRLTRTGTVHFALAGAPQVLELYWLEDYAGGLFLSFRDTTSGRLTYGAGRYLLDTAKGADLGMKEGRLVLDFNFAYNPSCSYDPRWVCPLAPPANRLDLEVRAGERLESPAQHEVP